MIKYLLYAVSIIVCISLIGCIPDWNDKDDGYNPCAEVSLQLDGTYVITITEYPLQTTTEGWTKDVLVFTQMNLCHSPEDTTKINRILFNNLFNGFGSLNCSGHQLLDNYRFIITYEDNVDWAGGPIRGEGTIIDGIFHFEGEVHNSTGDHPIVLDGYKESHDRRTDAC